MKKEPITYMKRALELAKNGQGTVAPNPMVGAVIVKDARVIGEGYHEKKGGPHAEVVAINASSESLDDVELYCTLEPCCHTNKLTPPCTDLIIKKKIKKVYIACLDPNPEVAGKGVQKLRDHNIEVSVGLLEKEAKELNKVFFKYIKTNTPYIHLKVALTLDGRMCSETGSSKWITSSAARKEVHDLRKSYDAIWVGMNTLINDDPSLNTRRASKVIKENKKIVIGNLNKLKKLKLKALRDQSKFFGINTGDSLNIEYESVSFNGDLEESVKWLGSKGISSILIEGGAQLISELIEKKLYDEITIYIAPKLIGNGPSLYENGANFNMEKALCLPGSWRLLNSNEAVYEVRK